MPYRRAWMRSSPSSSGTSPARMSPATSNGERSIATQHMIAAGPWRDDFADQGTSDLRQDSTVSPTTKGERAMDAINLGAADGLPPVDWAAVIEKLDAGSAPAPDAHNARTTWLSTINEDGSPHVTAVGALWLDGTFWFQTSE